MSKKKKRTEPGENWQTESHLLEKPQTGNYPLEDRAMKLAAQFMGEELLSLMGIRGTVKRIAPTEQVYLEVRSLLEDFNYEMEDGTWNHLEFMSSEITTEDMRRFRSYEAMISLHYQVEVVTYVICSSQVASSRNELKEGINTYQVRCVHLKNENADTIIEELERNQKERGLTRQEMMKLLLTPLMSGDIPQSKRIIRGLRMLQNEKEAMKRQELLCMQSVLYALAVKFLTDRELGKVKEILSMSVLGEMLIREGIEQGIEQGEFTTLYDLVQDGLLSMETAAGRKGLTIQDFQKKLKEFGIL